jgi:hypothetical protein
MRYLRATVFTIAFCIGLLMSYLGALLPSIAGMCLGDEE